MVAGVVETSLSLPGWQHPFTSVIVISDHAGKGHDETSNLKHGEEVHGVDRQ